MPPIARLVVDAPCTPGDLLIGRECFQAWTGGEMSGYEEAEVCGVRVEKNKSCGHMLRVRSLGTEVVYKIDRWD